MELETAELRPGPCVPSTGWRVLRKKTPPLESFRYYFLRSTVDQMLCLDTDNIAPTVDETGRRMVPLKCANRWGK